jgi:hypothetical protein
MTVVPLDVVVHLMVTELEPPMVTETFVISAAFVVNVASALQAPSEELVTDADRTR